MKPLLFNKTKHRWLFILSLGLILASVIISTARAGNVATRKIWGFSPDGQYFAFEEYGIQDGSDFPYSNFYISNTHKNSWVKGSPIRVVVQKESDDPTIARVQALAKAAPLIQKYLISKPGSVLAHNPVTEIGRDPLKVTVSPGPVPFMTAHALTFRLNEFSLPTKRCKDYGNEAQTGVELTVERKGFKKRSLIKDKRIPTSRGCPKSYAISDIIRFEGNRGAKEALYVVILQTFSYGFEGDDGRYIATAHWLPTYNSVN